MFILMSKSVSKIPNPDPWALGLVFFRRMIGGGRGGGATPATAAGPVLCYCWLCWCVLYNIMMYDVCFVFFNCWYYYTVYSVLVYYRIPYIYTVRNNNNHDSSNKQQASKLTRTTRETRGARTAHSSQNYSFALLSQLLYRRLDLVGKAITKKLNLNTALSH